jgi:hypothetical protein
MNDIKLVKGDREADAMLTCAVQNVMRQEIMQVIQKYARLVPESMGDQFVDYLYETQFIPDKVLTDNTAGSPDLFGDEAYDQYVRKVMEVKRGNDLL